MNWYKTARQTAYKRKMYPEQVTNKNALAFYNWLKAQNIVVYFYHGTSDLAYNLIEKTGWMTPPNWRGRQKEEGRYDENIHNDAEAGLDKLFFTKNFQQANSYAKRDATTWNSNYPKVITIKEKLNIDKNIIAKPLVIKISIPLHDLDEIKGNIYGTFIYNEFSFDEKIKNIIDSENTNKVKLNKILKIIKKTEEDNGEFTVKGGLPISKEKGFAHIKKLDADDYINALKNNQIDYEYLPNWIKETFPEKYEEAFVESIIIKLYKSPYNYDVIIPQWIMDKYPERMENAIVESFEKNILKAIHHHSYDNIPEWIRKKYPERIESAYITSVERRVRRSPYVYNYLPQWLVDKYPERTEKSHVISLESSIEKYPYSFDTIPENILSKYRKRMEQAYIKGLERILKINPLFFPNVPQWLVDKYPGVFNVYKKEFNKMKKSKNLSWYKLSQTKEDFMSIAREQRGLPESAMITAQHELGGGVMNFAIEHAGDLIHRMTEYNTFEYAGYMYVKEKVEKLLSIVNQSYGFIKEYKENLETNAKYHKENLEDRKDRVNIALKAYIQAHESLPTYNKAHQLAKTVAISIAKLEIPTAVSALKELKLHLNTEEEWTRFAHENLVLAQDDVKI